MVKYKEYWESRYRSGGNSGLGSYGNEAEFKKDYINDIIKRYNISTINEFGCGDGNILSKLYGFDFYYGYDISKTILEKCIDKFKNINNIKFIDDIKKFPISEMSMSIDVLYHIIDNDDFIEYLNNLIKYSSKYILIYGIDNAGESKVDHIKLRKFNEHLNNKVLLLEHKKYDEKNNGISFYFYKKL